MTAIEELRELASAAERKRGQLDAAQRKQAAACVAALLRDPPEESGMLLMVLEQIPSEALADGMATGWAVAPPALKTALRRWLDRHDSDRTTRRLVLTAAAILTSDPVVGVDLLDHALPPKRPPSQELKRYLRDAFFGHAPVKLESLEDANVVPRPAARLLGALWQSLDPSVPAGYRFSLAEACLRLVTRYKLADDATGQQLLVAVRKDRVTWPSELQQQLSAMENELSARAAPSEAGASAGGAPVPTGVDASVISQTPAGEVPPAAAAYPAAASSAAGSEISPLSGTPLAASPKPTSLPAELPAAVAVSPPAASAGQQAAAESVAKLGALVTEELVRIERQAAILRAVQRLLSEQTAMHAAREELERLRERYRALNLQLREQKRREESLFKRLRAVEQAAAEQTEYSAELSARLKASEANGKREREELLAHIQANSAVEVDNFRNRLAGNLRKLIGDLPERSAEISQASGQLLLRQYHQFIDMLEEDGVPVRQGTREKR